MKPSKRQKLDQVLESLDPLYTSDQDNNSSEDESLPHSPGNASSTLIKIESDLINSSSETVTPNLPTVPGTIDIITAQSLLTQLNEMKQKLDNLYKERNSDKAIIEELKKSHNNSEQEIQFLEKQAETQKREYQKIKGELEEKINSKADSSSSTALRTELKTDLDTKENKLTATINQHHTELKRENVNLSSQVTEAKQGLLIQFKTFKLQIESDLQGVKNQHNNHTHVVDSQSGSWCPVTFSPGVLHAPPPPAPPLQRIRVRDAFKY
jgi:hypothetical protein